ncbi:MAG TPA: TonB-dependent receptor [Blastocatellia bacterium]|nr:TonB-dependent receptor [Blastocatellia bacterium]
MKTTLTLKSFARLTLSALLLTTFALTAAFGQENTGAIRGTIKDSSGAAIPGAKITASSPALVRSIDVTSDKEGGYRFPKLPAGVYSITVTQTGFKTSKNEDITLLLGSELTLDVALSAGAVSESVTISASAEAIDVTSSKSATNITEKFIDNTPKGRTFNSLLQAAPGVIFDPRAGSVGPTATGTSGNSPGGGVGGYSVNGASGSENQFILDGVEVSNIRNAALGRESAIPFEFVREVQVKSGGFEAEYGGAVGAVVNVVTKSGANQFHGEGALMFTSAAFNSAGRGNWRSNVTAVTQPQFFRAKEDEYRTLYPGFSLGGPILKDRLHFFSAYFPEFNRTERSIAYPNGAETTTSRVLRHYAINRLDYAPTQKIQINTSYIWTPIRVSGLLKGNDPQVAKVTNDTSVLGGFTPAQAYTASFIYTLTPSLIVSARYGYKYTNDKGNTYGLPTGAYLTYARATSLQTNPPVPANLAGAQGFTNISNPFTVVKDVIDRHNVYLDGTYIKRIAGQQHTIKGGYALNRISNVVVDDYPNGRFDIYWGEQFTRGSITNRRGPFGYYIWEDGVRHNNGANSRNQGFYFQDQWQIHHRVTLNAGLRVENESLPPFTKVAANGARIPDPIRFGWGDKLAPRFGGAWDVLGDAKWKISASYGHFYDTMKYELARTSFGGDYWVSNVFTLDDPTKLSQVNKSSPGAAGTAITKYDNRTVPVNAQGELDGIDPDIHATFSRAFSVSSEHQLRGNMVASVRYTRNRLNYPIEDIGIFDAEENEIYVIGNPGFGLRSTSISTLSGIKLNLKSGQSLFPKAIRNYDGVEFRLDGRLSKDGLFRGLSYNMSYTYSRLYGNYPGLSSSDENGRSQPNVSRSFDLPYGNFDSKGNNVFGLLNTDRPHAFKLFGAYPVSWKGGETTFSLAQLAFSGTPRSTELAVVVPVFINGRNDLGRTPAFTQTDMMVAHSFKLGEGKSLKLDMNVINLFNQAAPVRYQVRINRAGNLSVGPPGSGAVLTDQQFVSGFDPSLYIKDPTTPVSATSLPRSPFYNLPIEFQGIREIRFGVHFLF